jgi:heterodisulfide reductase subunit A
MLARGKVTVEPLTAFVDEALCEGCGLCVTVCPYGAPRIVDTKDGRRSRVEEALCHGCGTCAASCPRLAIICRGFSDEQLASEAAEAFGGGDGEGAK